MKDRPQPEYTPRKHSFQNRDSRDRPWNSDRPQRRFDEERPRRSFDGPPQRRSFDGPPQRRSFDGPPRRSFDGPRGNFERRDDDRQQREPRVWRQGEDGNGESRVCTDIDGWQKSRELYAALREGLEGCVDPQFRDRLLNTSLQICADIANAVERGSHAGLQRLLEDARGGCGVVRGLLHIAQDMELLDAEEVTALNETCGRISVALGQLQRRRD